MRGRVDKIFEDRYFGFLWAQGGGRYFFSFRSIVGEPVAKGDEVEFDVADDPRGREGDMIAVNVRYVGSATIDPGRLFVGNLPTFCTDEDLKSCFGQVGEILTVHLITDSEGTSKGFGFVQYRTQRDALQAICDFHGAEWGGRRITVRQALRQQSRPTARRG